MSYFTEITVLYGTWATHHRHNCRNCVQKNNPPYCKTKDLDRENSYAKVREVQQFKLLYCLCRSLLPATPYFHPAIAVKGPHEPPGSYCRTHEQHPTLNFMSFNFRFILRITIIGGGECASTEEGKGEENDFWSVLHDFLVVQKTIKKTNYEVNNGH